MRGGGLAAEVDLLGDVDDDVVGAVDRDAAEVGGIEDLRSSRVELGEEGVIAALEVGLERVADGEVRRLGVAGDVGLAIGIDGDAFDKILVGPAKVGGVDEAGAFGVDLGDEAVAEDAAAERLLDSFVGDGELPEGIGHTGDVDTILHVEGDGDAAILIKYTAAAEVGGIENGGAAGVDLGDVGVEAVAALRLQGGGGGS